MTNRAIVIAATAVIATSCSQSVASEADAGARSADESAMAAQSQARLSLPLANGSNVLRSAEVVTVVNVASQTMQERFDVFSSTIEQEQSEERHSGRTPSYIRDAQIVEEQFLRLFLPYTNPQEMETLSGSELDLVHRAAHTAGFYTFKREYALDSINILAALERKRAVTETHYTMTYELLVRVRDFDRARELAVRHPSAEFEPLPRIYAESSSHLLPGPQEWVVSDNKNELLQRAVVLDRGPKVIVVSHPLCHFSRNAVAFIDSDPVLRSLYHSHAKWIAPQDGRLEIAALKAWNREHPRYPVSLVVTQKEWTFIDYWGTPAFYFLVDGEVIERVVGWPREGRRNEILDAFQRIGVVTHATRQKRMTSDATRETRRKNQP